MLFEGTAAGIGEVLFFFLCIAIIFGFRGVNTVARWFDPNKHSKK